MSQGQLTVRFMNHELKQGAVFYTISISDMISKESWLTTTRYSALRAIHKNMREIYTGDMPEFPPKKLFGNTDETFISTRKKSLENYLNTLLKNVNLNQVPPLKDFLLRDRDKRAKKMTQKLENGEGEKPSALVLQKKLSDETVPGKLFENAPVQNKVGIDDIKNNFLDLGGQLQSPDEEDVKKKRNQYSKMNYKCKSGLLEKLEIPKSCELNLVQFKKPTLIKRDDSVYSLMDDAVKNINRNHSRIENILFYSELKIIHHHSTEDRGFRKN